MKKTFGINALQLKILAMVFMLCDHMWATIIHGNDWLTCVGRLAFPIFAFQIAEGYAHTHDAKAYRRRLLIWALISEIPFNLMVGGGPIYPFHQNVLFTFWIALLVLDRMERTKARGGKLSWFAYGVWPWAGYLFGFLGFTDYYGYGVLMVISFALFRESKVLQFVIMAIINVFWMKGLGYPVDFLGREWFIPQQAFAMLALIPIWLYNGEQGPYNKTIRRVCYAFYPAHILALVMIGTIAEFCLN